MSGSPASILTEIAYAKINLALHVRARRSDGYHELETIFAFVDDGDVLEAQPADALTLDIVGPFSDSLDSGSGNLVMKTAMRLQKQFDVKTGARMVLDKRLPVASGIGGGSADAAAAARLLNQLWALGLNYEELAELLAPLGADIPACVHSICARGQGTGTDLQLYPENDVQNWPILLVNPGAALATGPVFEGWDGWDGIDRGALADLSLSQISYNGRNDLQISAISLCPAVADVLDVLGQQPCKFARMSGSGATCFALYDSDELRDDAARRVAEAHPEWWILAGRIR